MEQNMQNDFMKDLSVKFGNWISPRLLKYELIIFIIFLIALVLRVLTQVDYAMLMIIPLLVLSSLYFFSAFSQPVNETLDGLQLFIKKLIALGTSVAVTGILFRLENWPGSGLMMMMGCYTCLGIIPLGLILKQIKPEQQLLNMRIVLRLIIISALGLTLLYTPVDILLKYKVLKEPDVEVSG